MMRKTACSRWYCPRRAGSTGLQRLIAIEPAPDPLRRLGRARRGRWRGRHGARRAFALLERLARPAPWPCAALAARSAGDGRAQRRALYRLGAERYRDIALLLAAEGEMSRSRLAELLDLAGIWTPPVFPLAGRDVTALGIPPGERVGQLLAAVREWWEEGDFTADRAACLAHSEGARDRHAAGLILPEGRPIYHA